MVVVGGGVVLAALAAAVVAGGTSSSSFSCEVVLAHSGGCRRRGLRHWGVFVVVVVVREVPAGGERRWGQRRQIARRVWRRLWAGRQGGSLRVVIGTTGSGAWSRRQALQTTREIFPVRLGALQNRYCRRSSGPIVGVVAACVGFRGGCRSKTTVRRRAWCFRSSSMMAPNNIPRSCLSVLHTKR